MMKQRIGAGVYRIVYWIEGTNKVVKVAKEDRAGRAHNLNEWNTWQRLTKLDHPHKEFLCPCISISLDNTELEMQYAPPAKPERKTKFKVPRHWPTYFRDCKPVNCGVYDGRIVLVDYGHPKIYEHVRNYL